MRIPEFSVAACPLFFVRMCHGLNNNKENWSKLIIYRNFKLLPLSLVQVLLESDDLTRTEEVLWDNAVLWAKYQFEKDHSMPSVEEGGWFG